MLRRIKLILAVAAAMTMLIVGAAPAMANDWDWNDRHDNDKHWNNWNDRHDNGDDDVDVDVEGPFLVDDEVCVFVVTEEEEWHGDEDVDVDEECVDFV
jgi:opacity protein-like surface antigen